MDEKISLQDENQEIEEYFGEDVRDNDSFENYRKNIVTTIAYLIGVPEDKFIEDKFDLEQYEKIKTNQNALIIRKLCILRTQFFRNYKAIMDARNLNLTPLETMTDYLDIEAIKYLRARDMEVNIANAPNPTTHIAYINQYILDNIDKIKPLIPDWVKFQYIRPLFLMPGCYSGHGGANLKQKSSYQKVFSAILEVSKRYVPQRSSYPYQMYISWPMRFRETDGNVLYNDLKFLRMLYAASGDRFQASRYVVDARSDTKEGVYAFLADAVNVAIFVDCENVDPYAFGATILNLDEEELSKIKKIVLYNDVHTSSAWDYIMDIINIPVEEEKIERLLDNKSLVDIRLTSGVCREYYQNNMESIILASSDSDFWGLIVTLPSARFLVLNEFRKTSSAIIEKLDTNNISHCYMSDFAQDIIQKFKSDVLYLGLLERIRRFNETGAFLPLDVDELIRELFFDAHISGADGQVEREKKAFYEKYLKGGLLIKPVEENGKLRFKIEISKK